MPLLTQQMGTDELPQFGNHLCMPAQAHVVAIPGDPVPDAVREAAGGTDTVPLGAVVVLGNALRSSDSRQWGFIPARSVFGTGWRRLT